jgi:probable rRNA maturation factor
VDIRINLRSTALDKWNKYKSHITAKELKRITAKGLETIEADVPGIELSVLLTDDNEMRDYNARFRGVDKPTNVLSFPWESQDADSLSYSRKKLAKQRVYLGDIAMGYTTVATEAEQLSVPLHSYTYYLFVHGLLHLLGYVHDKKKDREQMESLETAILKKIEIDANCFR